MLPPYPPLPIQFPKTHWFPEILFQISLGCSQTHKETKDQSSKDFAYFPLGLSFVTSSAQSASTHPAQTHLYGFFAKVKTGKQKTSAFSD